MNNFNFLVKATLLILPSIISFGLYAQNAPTTELNNKLTISEYTDFFDPDKNSQQHFSPDILLYLSSIDLDFSLKNIDRVNLAIEEKYVTDPNHHLEISDIILLSNLLQNTAKVDFCKIGDFLETGNTYQCFDKLIEQVSEETQIKGCDNFCQLAVSSLFDMSSSQINPGFWSENATKSQQKSIDFIKASDSDLNEVDSHISTLTDFHFCPALTTEYFKGLPNSVLGQICSDKLDDLPNLDKFIFLQSFFDVCEVAENQRYCRENAGATLSMGYCLPPYFLLTSEIDVMEFYDSELFRSCLRDKIVK